ncbi:anti-sigma factor family protein, partial [Kitasatospora sp. P5_F3]
MTPSWTEAGHPDVELLADLAEDLTDPAELPLLQAHLAGCAECTDTYAALAEVRELLGAVEDFPPLPAELADRIDAALAVEAAVPVTPAADPATPLTRRRPGPPG